jgi:hypothetical protein
MASPPRGRAPTSLNPTLERPLLFWPCATRASDSRVCVGVGVVHEKPHVRLRQQVLALVRDSDQQPARRPRTCSRGDAAARFSAGKATGSCTARTTHNPPCRPQPNMQTVLCFTCPCLVRGPHALPAARCIRVAPRCVRVATPHVRGLQTRRWASIRPARVRSWCDDAGPEPGWRRLQTLLLAQARECAGAAKWTTGIKAKIRIICKCLCQRVKQGETGHADVAAEDNGLGPMLGTRQLRESRL